MAEPRPSWSLYFFGATWIHAKTWAEADALTPWWLFRIVLSHALLPLVMIALVLWRSKLAKRRSPAVD